jgi:hypothetical protein
MFIWTSFLSPPGIDRFVVIASQDSPEIHSYTDEAIGHFDPDESVLDGAHRTIADWWRSQATEASQPLWESLIQAGEVDRDTAWAWAREVWDADSAIYFLNYYINQQVM